MPSSFVRREYRQCTGENRKVCTFRWIPRQTVGVCQLARAPNLGWVEGEKAEDGAEKSFRRCRRRRRRGQRRGKTRSRGDKPRSSSPRRPLEPKGGVARRINHSGRKFIWGERARSNLVNSKYFRVLEQALSREDPDLDRDAAAAVIGPSWASHVRALRAHARKAGIPDGANPFGRSALDFVLTNSSIHSEMAFHDILGGLRFNVSPAEFHDLTVGADLRSGVEPSVSELPAQGERIPTKKRLSRAVRTPVHSEPIPGPVQTGIVRPWERRERRRPALSRPFRKGQDREFDARD